MSETKIDLSQYHNSLSRKHQVIRLIWGVVWPMATWFLPRSMGMPWKRTLLRAFGAKVADTANVYSSAKVYFPSNLTMGEYSCLASDVDCYNVAPIRIGANATVSQGAYLCTASHDITDPLNHLITAPIVIEDQAWIGAKAFVGMGVTIGQGAVVGATASVYKNVESWTVVGGNPAKFIKMRVIEKNNMRGVIPLLMTASVSTRGMKGACFSDEEREMMYVTALTFYIENLLKRDEKYSIVFAENSGWDLSKIKSKLPSFDEKKIEFISLPPDKFDVSKGKGYNELLLINKAMGISELIREAGVFFKVTGRYPVYNIRHFVDKAFTFLSIGGGDLYADIKDHKLYDWLRLGWCGHSFDCRLFGVRTEWFKKHMAPLYCKCNDYEGILLEGVLFELIKNPIGKLSLRFDREPHFGGLEGSNVDAVSFSKKQDSIKGKVKRMTGNSIRIFMPWFKF